MTLALLKPKTIFGKLILVSHLITRSRRGYLSNLRKPSIVKNEITPTRYSNFVHKKNGQTWLSHSGESRTKGQKTIKGRCGDNDFIQKRGRKMVTLHGTRGPDPLDMSAKDYRGNKKWPQQGWLECNVEEASRTGPRVMDKDYRSLFEKSFISKMRSRGATLYVGTSQRVAKLYTSPNCIPQ